MWFEKKSEAGAKLELFEQAIMPHFDAAYNLARWMMRHTQDAEDAVQEAYTRAFRFFDTFQGGDGRVWLLAIVRNTCRTQLEQRTVRDRSTEWNDDAHAAMGPGPDPERQLLRDEVIGSVRLCIDGLPLEYREAIVMRELEQLSYREIAEAASVPLGTVMSRLARARARLQQCLAVRVRGTKV